MAFERGDLCVRVADPTGPVCRILGGPTMLGGHSHYSVLWEPEGRPSSAQFPRVMPELALALYMHAVKAPSANCPNCGIDDMLFYFDDYICAWCREMLEDGL